MLSNKKTGNTLAALAALLATQTSLAANGLFDSASLEAGAGSQVKIVRIAAQSDWNARWLARNGYHMSGYWDVNLAQWRGDAYRDIPDRHQDITVVGVTPVFRYQRDDKLGWYGEAAIGVSLFSETYNNNDYRLSTAFQFADHIAIGYVLGKKWDLSARIQHYSNGGIKQPNTGVNLLLLKAAYRF